MLTEELREELSLQFDPGAYNGAAYKAALFVLIIMFDLSGDYVSCDEKISVNKKK